MDDYITVVEVDDPTSNKDTNHSGHHQAVKRNNSIQDSSFITVLSINDAPSLTQTTSVIHTNAATDNTHRLHKNNNNNNIESDIETVLVYRLPGERLGFGLKFQGGTRSSERVQRLFIQSCAKDSPASRVESSWGNLREGDEIVSIDGKAVCEMTRIDCVRCLKDNVAIKLVVRNGFGQLPTGGDGSGEEESRSTKMSPPPPPPVPPRKLVKRRQIKDGKVANTVDEKPFTPPPDAEYYINLFSDENNLKAAGSESDDTASTISTISTVIDKFSISSNYSSETDLSSFSSMNGNSVMNKADLAKVLKPFTMLEQEFKIGEASMKNDDPTKKLSTASPAPPTNNYENIDLKVEKLNVYENVELKPKDSTDGVDKNGIPTPKPRPRQTAIVEPKKRSIIPTPRKFNGMKMEVQESAESPVKSEDNKLITKIPKAIAAVFGSSSPKGSAMERSKTESELKLNQHSRSTSDLRKQCERFLESEVKSSQENLAIEKPLSEDGKTGKSKIPVVLSSRKSLEMESPPKIETILIKPRTMVQKQKSETDLKLTSYRPKDQRPTNLPILKATSPVKPSLQRSNSADSKARESPSLLKSPERTLIPVLNQSPTSEAGSPTKVKGPKPKPPERVQSLAKTQIPKLHQAASPVTSSSNTTQLIVNNLEPTMIPVTPPTPTMQTFKQSPSHPLKTASPPQNREIKFKIQTYESSQLEKEKNPFTDVNGNEESVMPSLFDLVRKNSPSSQRKEEEPSSPQKIIENSKNYEKNPESPVIVKKCIKISAEQQQADTYYSSSSSGSSDDDDECGDEKEYEIEDGEKLGPPELVNGPGPSEAYFNMYWHSNMLPTIGEVEEEFSSLELQQVSNGPIVIVNDVIQNHQQPKQQQQLPSQSQQHQQENLNKQKKPPSAAEITTNFIQAEVINVTKNDNDNNPKSISSAAIITLPKSNAVLTSNTSHNKSSDSKTTPAAVNDIKQQQKTNTDSENADDKITDIDLSTTTIPQVKECDSNKTNDKIKIDDTNVIETTSNSLITEKSHPPQVNAANSTDNEISTRDSSVSKGVSEELLTPSSSPEVKPIEMNQSEDSQIVVGRAITKTVKTITTQKTIKSSQKIESFEQIDGNNPESSQISLINKSESNEEVSSSIKKVEEVKIPTDLVKEKITKVAEMEETFKSDKIASTQTIERKDDKEHVHQEVECQSEQAAIKATIKETSEEPKNLPKDGITVTVKTETRLIEMGKGGDDDKSDDRQSIVTGILSLSESGIRTKQNSNQIEVVECKHEKQEGFAEIDLVRDLKKKEGVSTENRKSLEDEKVTKKLDEEVEEVPILEKTVEEVLETVNKELVKEEVQQKVEEPTKTIDEDVQKPLETIEKVENEIVFEKCKLKDKISNTIESISKIVEDEKSLPKIDSQSAVPVEEVENTITFEKCKVKAKEAPKPAARTKSISNSESADESTVKSQEITEITGTTETKEEVVKSLPKVISEPAEIIKKVEEVITFEKCKVKTKDLIETAIEISSETPQPAKRTKTLSSSDTGAVPKVKSSEVIKEAAKKPNEIEKPILEVQVNVLDKNLLFSEVESAAESQSVILEEYISTVLASSEIDTILDKKEPVAIKETVVIEEIQTQPDLAENDAKGFEEIFNDPDPAPLYVLRKNIIHCDPPKQDQKTSSKSKRTTSSISSDLPKDQSKTTEKKSEKMEEISTDLPKSDKIISKTASSKDQLKSPTKKKEEELPSATNEIPESAFEQSLQSRTPVEKPAVSNDISKTAPNEDLQSITSVKNHEEKLPSASSDILKTTPEKDLQSITPLQNQDSADKSVSEEKLSPSITDTQVKIISEEVAEVLPLPVPRSSAVKNKSDKSEAKISEETSKTEEIVPPKAEDVLKTQKTTSTTTKGQVSMEEEKAATSKPESSKTEKTLSLKKSKSDAEQSSQTKVEVRPREFTAKVIDVMKKTPIDSKDSRTKSLNKSSSLPTEARTEPNGLECKTTMPTSTVAVATVNTNTAGTVMTISSMTTKPKPMERIILGVEHNPDDGSGHAKSLNEFQSKVKTTTKTTTNSESQAGPEASKSSTSTTTGPSSSTTLLFESALTPKTTTTNTTSASLVKSTSSSSECPGDVNEEKGLLTHCEDKQGK